MAGLPGEDGCGRQPADGVSGSRMADNGLPNCMVFPFLAREASILKEKVPYPVGALLQNIQRLKQLMALPKTVHRFHATRPLAEQYQSEVVVFLLTLNLKQEAAKEAMSILDNREGCSAARVVGLRMLPERPQRQPLTEQLQNGLKPK